MMWCHNKSCRVQSLDFSCGFYLKFYTAFKLLSLNKWCSRQKNESVMFLIKILWICWLFLIEKMWSIAFCHGLRAETNAVAATFEFKRYHKFSWIVSSFHNVQWQPWKCSISRYEVKLLSTTPKCYMQCTLIE